MEECTSYEIICSYLPISLREPLLNVSKKYRNKLSEIRIRVNRPICLVYPDNLQFLCNDGTTSYSFDRQSVVIAYKKDIDSIINALCRFSVHSFVREFSQCFFTIENGVRVGVAGKMSSTGEKTLKHINAFNFRISREIIGCSENIYTRLFSESCKNILICGGVNSGKTTILRDLCRLCGNRFKTVLIDERNEISGSVSGIPNNDIGIQTDVLEGYERSDGIITAIRTLSPQLIFCDEISSNNDSEAILSGYGCGVKFVTSIHAQSYQEILCRSVIKKLLEKGVFEYAVILEGENFPGRIREIRRLCGAT